MSFAVFGILDRNGSLFGYNQSDWCVYGYAARSIVELTFRIVSTYQSLQKSHKSKTDHQFRLLAHDQFAEVTELAIFFLSSLINSYWFKTLMLLSNSPKI